MEGIRWRRSVVFIVILMIGMIEVSGFVLGFVT
jgi:hypothetical protein